MIAGSLLVGLCLFMLGWSKEIVSVLVSDEEAVSRLLLLVKQLNGLALRYAKYVG
jgi:hypothetical protein